MSRKKNTAYDYIDDDFYDDYDCYEDEHYNEGVPDHHEGATSATQINQNGLTTEEGSVILEFKCICLNTH